MDKDTLIKKGDKILIISLCVILPLAIGWFIYATWFNDPIPEPQTSAPKYIEYDSSAYEPKKVKYKNRETYATYTVYMLSFEDGYEMNVDWKTWMKLEIGDSTNAQVEYRVKRLIN